MKSEPYQKINIAQPGGSLCLFTRVPSLIKLARHSNGSFYLDGLESNNLMHSQRLREILDSIIAKILELESINAKGYVNSTRLSDYPILSGYLEPYVKSVKLASLDGVGLAKLSEQGKLNLIDSELTLREKRVIITWFYSLFNLNLYYLILDVLDRLGLANTEAFENPEVLDEKEKFLIADLIADLKTYAGKLYGNISPSIREAMRQRGITVTENIYCGYDTEFKNVDMKENQILSAQWAVNSKIILSLPHLCVYNLSGMNIHSGEEYPINSK
jgi:hypothetical protein